jgi:uncharacterized protein YjiS (DUF1127 family)
MRVIDQWRENRRNRAAYKAPNSLGERLLADIGIDQTDLNNLRRGRSHNGR